MSIGSRRSALVWYTPTPYNCGRMSFVMSAYDLPVSLVREVLRTHGNRAAWQTLGVSRSTVMRLRHITEIPSPGKSPTPRQDAVLQALQGRSLSSTQLCALFGGISHNAINVCLSALERMGKVERSGKARQTRWRLAGPRVHGT